MVVICEDKQYTIKLLDKLLTDLWGEVKLLASDIGDKITEMNITKLVFLASEAQQQYYLLSRSEKAVISSDLYYEIAYRCEIDVERFTFAGESARS